MSEIWTRLTKLTGKKRKVIEPFAKGGESPRKPQTPFPRPIAELTRFSSFFDSPEAVKGNFGSECNDLESSVLRFLVVQFSTTRSQSHESKVKRVISQCFSVEANRK